MQTLMRRLLLPVTLVMAVAIVAAHEVTYKGTVISVEPAKLQVKVIDDKDDKKTTPMTFAITDKTKIFRGDIELKLADAKIVKDERVAVTINHDEAGYKALEIRLAKNR